MSERIGRMGRGREGQAERIGGGRRGKRRGRCIRVSKSLFELSFDTERRRLPDERGYEG